jgi:hypothetical protein
VILRPYGVAVGVEGEIVVSDDTRHDVQVFSKNGVHLQTIGMGGNSELELIIPDGVTVDRLELRSLPDGVAVDCEGRVFVGCNRQKKVLMLF